MGLPDSHKVPRASWYSGFWSVFAHFAYGTFTLYGLHVPVSHSAMPSESFYQSITPSHPLYGHPGCSVAWGLIVRNLLLACSFFSNFLPLTSNLQHPHSGCDGLGSSAFARHYLRNLRWFLFLRVLRCFSSPRIPPVHYGFMYRYLRGYLKWVSPFGNPRVDGYLRLTVAYRSLSRPSSAPGAKAFTLCS